MKSINKIILTVSLCYFGQNALAAAVTRNRKLPLLLILNYSTGNQAMPNTRHGGGRYF
ncbi:hypothetical protein [Coxiella burnetii]|uniref:hypothetical protein n=1 Tax=Coxiella burnetii TaxID=777 RepID=UPI0021763E9F|nr:hypothetical protein [Coxiella burnetii]